MPKKSYAEKLKDPRWQKKRLDLLNAANFACRECGDKETTLHVHHLCYESGKDPWDYNDCVYKVLCATCHEERQAVERAVAIRLGNFTASQLDGISLSIAIAADTSSPELVEQLVDQALTNGIGLPKDGQSIALEIAANKANKEATREDARHLAKSAVRRFCESNGIPFNESGVSY